MKNRFTSAIIVLLLIFGVSSVVMAQTAGGQGQAAAAGPRNPWKFYPKDRAEGDGGPAPKRDLTGTWAGPGSGMAVPRGSNVEAPTPPPLTPLGEKMLALNKPIGKYSPAGTNDPHTRYCDPYGFPQNMTNEIRGLQFATMPNKVIMLIQYMDQWREIWTDGRPLPTNVGASGKDALDPRYNGYSVGRWEDDYTFVVDTTGMDDVTWATKNGMPHSLDAHVREVYKRLSKNDLQLTITMTDPKIYTKPFEIGTIHFRWIPNQQLDEWLCVPSEVEEYLKTMGDPAGFDPNSSGRNR